MQVDFQGRKIIPVVPELGFIRAVASANAGWADGLSAGDKGTDRASFEYMLGSPPAGAKHFDLDRPFRCYQKEGKWITEGTSTCGLFAERVLELSGIAVPWAGKPYTVGSAIGRLNSWACLKGVRMAMSWVTMPKVGAGDVFVVGSAISTHEAVILSLGVKSGGITIGSMDGGQSEPKRGLQLITAKTREFRPDKSGVFFDARGRKMQYVVSLEAIVKAGLLADECSVPEDFEA